MGKRKQSEFTRQRVFRFAARSPIRMSDMHRWRKTFLEQGRTLKFSSKNSLHYEGIDTPALSVCFFASSIDTHFENGVIKGAYCEIFKPMSHSEIWHQTNRIELIIAEDTDDFRDEEIPGLLFHFAACLNLVEDVIYNRNQQECPYTDTDFQRSIFCGFDYKKEKEKWSLALVTTPTTVSTRLFKCWKCMDLKMACEFGKKSFAKVLSSYVNKSVVCCRDCRDFACRFNGDIEYCAVSKKQK